MNLLPIIEQIVRKVISETVKMDIFRATIVSVHPLKLRVEDSTKEILERQVVFLESSKPLAYSLEVPKVVRYRYEGGIENETDFVISPCQGHPEGCGYGTMFGDGGASSIIFSTTTHEFSSSSKLKVGDTVALLRVGKSYLCYGRTINVSEVVE